MADTVVIIDCSDPSAEPEVREATPEEQAWLDAQRAAEEARITQVGTRVISITEIVTTDDAVTEVLRFACEPTHLYRASLTIMGIDRTNFVSLTQEGRFVWKRPGTGNVPAPGITVVSQIPGTIPTGWATNCVASGADVVFTVKGPAGRTIDWSLDGAVLVFAPGGLGG
jgi:hypothetical protein